MSTIHLFGSNNNSPSSLGSLEKTINIKYLLETPLHQRDSKWIDRFLENIDECNLQISEPEVAIAKDGFPYVNVNTVNPDANFKAFVLVHELERLLKSGFGLVINANSGRPDWLFSYGDLLNYKLNHEFYTYESVFSEHGQDFVIPKEEKILVGQPSDEILPKQARQHIREFLNYSGIKYGKVLLMARNYEDERKVSQDLVFNITPHKCATQEEYINIMNTLAWFLPKHYSIAGVDESVIQSGFEAI